MSDILKNKLLRHEEPPPANTWNSISVRLDNEFLSADSVISAKVDDTSVIPPASAWTEIASFLDNEASPAQPVKVVPMLSRRIAVAAVLAGLVALSAIYLFTGRQGISARDVALVKNNTSVNTDASRMMHIPSPAREIGTRPLASLRTIVTEPRNYVRRTPSEADEVQDLYASIGEPYFSDMQTVTAEQPVNVPVRPIRDASGNIIMDLSLISKPDDPYITVTGPNGSQTRISNKFISCLSYLNSDVTPDKAGNDGINCKDMFQTWRDKLLSEASFIPTAGNFFDIFEMKDMIQE